MNKNIILGMIAVVIILSMLYPNKNVEKLKNIVGLGGKTKHSNQIFFSRKLNLL